LFFNSSNKLSQWENKRKWDLINPNKAQNPDQHENASRNIMHPFLVYVLVEFPAGEDCLNPLTGVEKSV